MTTNRVDGRRPDSPALSAPGPHPIGVRTLTLTDPDRPDVLASMAAGRLVRGPRVLCVELWYPAAPGTPPGGHYDTILRDGITPARLYGQAARDAAPARGQVPLVLISHGYPGNRHLMAHLAEHLASHGYVVAAPDHPDSTYADQAAFGSTLYNRPLDQAFVIAAITRDPVLAALADTSNTAVIGYSMGGYGALVLSGAGLTQDMATHQAAPPHDLLSMHLAESESHRALIDAAAPRAMVAFGPWGMNNGLWDAKGLSGLRPPTLIIAGSKDDVSGYQAMRDIFTGATHTDRHLLTFTNAGHNAGAPIPAPAESYAHSDTLGWSPFEHYADAVWDSVKMNTVSQHFILAFLDLHLRDNRSRAPYLNLVPDANDALWSHENGQPTPAHTYWPGFTEGAATGLRFETLFKGA